MLFLDRIKLKVGDLIYEKPHTRCRTLEDGLYRVKAIIYSPIAEHIDGMPVHLVYVENHFRRLEVFYDCSPLSKDLEIYKPNDAS